MLAACNENLQQSYARSTVSQIIMMAATLDRDRDTASGATDAPQGVGSSGNDEETEDGSTVFRIRSGEETGHGRWRRDTRCCTQEETE